jgi:hypothetical protein
MRKKGSDNSFFGLTEPRVSPLKSLKLQMNEINSEASLEKLRFALLHSHLKHLDLSYNHIGCGGIRQVATALT